MKYLKFKSMTFWAGVFLILKGLATTAAEGTLDVQALSEGAGLIGLRRAMGE